MSLRMRSMKQSQTIKKVAKFFELGAVQTLGGCFTFVRKDEHRMDNNNSLKYISNL